MAIGGIGQVEFKAKRCCTFERLYNSAFQELLLVSAHEKINSIVGGHLIWAVEKVLDWDQLV